MHQSRLVLKFTLGLVECLLGAVLFTPGLWAQGVLTWHNDAARTGQNPYETLLTPTNVNSTNFGRRATVTLDGPVDAQPLYVPGLIVNSGTHNVLYVATENDTLYALDADTGALLWAHSTLNGQNVSDSDNGCGQVGSKVGITSTPAIDLSSGPDGTIFLVAMTKDNSNKYHQWVHALDLLSGSEESGWPVEVIATYPGTGPNSSGGVVTFVPQQYKERAGLLISNGVVYTTWASNCDAGAYNGWVIGYSESTHAQTVLNLTPNGRDGAIWMSGAGPAADAGGNLYFLVANGYFDGTLNANGFPADGDYGNAFIDISTTSGLAVADYFTSDNSPIETQSQNDDDLGSGGELLLPVLNDAMGNPHELAVGAGKDGIAYVVDRSDMGKYNGMSNAVYQQFGLGGGVYSSPAWFNNNLYYGAVGQQISLFPYSDGSFGSASHQTSVSGGFGFPGTTPSISANGLTNGIVWAVQTGSPAVLYAFNASDLSELYNTTQAASSRDSFGNGITFTTPMIADGKVYVGTTTGVAIFGLLNCSYAVAPSASGTTVTATVTTGAGCSWTAASGSDFITIQSGASGTGDGAAVFQWSTFAGSSETGLVYVAGQTFAINVTGPNSLGLPSGPSPANGSQGAPVSPTLSWAASSGATSYTVYFGTSPTPPMVTSTASTSYSPGVLVPGITYYWMVVANNGGGSNGSTVWSFTTTTATVVSVNPNSGSGTSHSFALQYSDTAGAASLQQAWVWFAASGAAESNSCMLYYNVAANQINLLNNGASAWQPATPGTATTLQNSQCSVAMASSSVTLSGKTLTLNLAMTFQASYAGSKNIYVYAADVTGASSGWQQPGSWTVPGGATVTAVSIMPNSGSGTSQSFESQYSDTAGAASLQQAYVWFAAPGAAESNSCMLYYNVAANQINLLNNGATAWQPATPGTATTLQNSQCSVAVASSSVTLSGNTLTLNLAMTFEASYAGVKSIYLYAADVSGANSGWQQPGSWTVPGGATVTAVSVMPNSGSGTSQSFESQYSDTAGAASLQQAYVWFAAAGAAESNSCMLYYNVAANQINLLNNGATAWQPATPGTATTLQNSQCSVAMASSSAMLSGNTLTLNLAVTFEASYAGVKNIYLYAVDVSGANSGWQQPGSWTVPGGATVTAVSVMPNSGSGTSQSFAAQYSDTAGAASLQQAYVWFAAPGAPENNSCMMYYNVAANQINLLNDAATAWQPAMPGAATTLQNSQCSVAMASSSATLSGNTLTLDLAITFQPAFAGSNNIYLYAFDVSGANSGWQQPGTWTVP
jgi:PQQ enzyme repeat